MTIQTMNKEAYLDLKKKLFFERKRMRQISLSRFQRNKVERKFYHELKHSLFLKKMNSLELQNVE